MGFLASAGIALLLKLVIAATAAGFGLLGVGTNTRDVNGRLTKYGKITVAGLVTAGILSFGLAITEYAAGESKEAMEAARVKEEADRSRRLLQSIQRGLYPLRGTLVSIEFELPHGSLQKTREFLKNVAGDPINCINAESRKLATCRVRPRVRGLTGITDQVIGVSVASSSTYFVPEAEEREFLNLAAFRMRILANPDVRPGAEISTRKAVVSPSPQKHAKHGVIDYDFEADKLTYRLIDLPIDDSAMRAMGFYSLVDIAPSLFVLQPLFDRLTIRSAEITFGYPKKIVFDVQIYGCLGALLPADVESIGTSDLKVVERHMGLLPPLCRNHPFDRDDGHSD